MAKSSKGSKVQKKNEQSKNARQKRTSKSTNSQSTSNKSTNNKPGKNGQSQDNLTLLEKFFIAQLKDIYYAEQAIVKALPKMDEAASSEELKEAFQDHLHQTKRHATRLERVFESIGMQPQGKKCEAIEGIIKEAESIISETEEGTATRDAALIVAAQKVEHYEIATYGGLVQLAITAGLYEVADLLDKTLLEEYETDDLLTEIAETHINMEAENEDYGSWGMEEEEMNEEEGRQGQGKQQQGQGQEQEQEEEGEEGEEEMEINAVEY